MAIKNFGIDESELPIRIDCFDPGVNTVFIGGLSGSWVKIYESELILFNPGSSGIYKIYSNAEYNKLCILLDGGEIKTLYFLNADKNIEIETVYNELNEWLGNENEEKEMNHFDPFMKFIKRMIELNEDD